MIYILLANGFEEIEALTPRDILLRGGVDVKTVGVNSINVESANKLKISTDVSIDDLNFENLEGIILPGGMPGTTNLEKNQKVLDLTHFCSKNKLLISAICAAPSILGKMNILENKDACCYPGFEKFLKNANVNEKSVNVCENIITSRGPGTVFDFSFSILEYLKGEKLKIDVASQIQYV